MHSSVDRMPRTISARETRLLNRRRELARLLCKHACHSNLSTLCFEVTMCSTNWAICFSVAVNSNRSKPALFGTTLKGGGRLLKRSGTLEKQISYLQLCLEWQGEAASSQTPSQSQATGLDLSCRRARFAVVSLRPVVLDLGV
jgi:hypothetical protein